jgi:hypothetical protein
MIEVGHSRWIMVFGAMGRTWIAAAPRRVCYGPITTLNSLCRGGDKATTGGPSLSKVSLQFHLGAQSRLPVIEPDNTVQKIYKAQNIFRTHDDF